MRLKTYMVYGQCWRWYENETEWRNGNVSKQACIAKAISGDDQMCLDVLLRFNPTSRWSTPSFTPSRNISFIRCSNVTLDGCGLNPFFRIWNYPIKSIIMMNGNSILLFNTKIILVLFQIKQKYLCANIFKKVKFHKNTPTKFL